MTTLVDRLTYRMAQTARVGWFAAHYAAARRLGGPITPPDEPVFVPNSPGTSPAAVSRALAELFERDWANVEKGLYAAPHDQVQNPLALLRRSRRFFQDLPKLDRRRLNRAHSEVDTPDRRGRYPRYYLQNFHYQSDGYLSEDSAKLYDYQVEVLFSGSADAMRRQALVPLYEALKGKDQRRMSLLDVACGTGRFLTFVKDNYPRLNVTALDLSREYLAEARRALTPWSGVDFMHANAEHIPCNDAAFDVVTCIYLFHELPPRVRRVVLKEIAHALQPGGTFIFVDSLQTGDCEGLDRLLEYFPIGFHEPYFNSYAKENLIDLFAAAGLQIISQTPAFLSKVVVAQKR